MQLASSRGLTLSSKWLPLQMGMFTRGKSTLFPTDEEQLKSWLEARPSIDDLSRLTPVSNVLERYLASDPKEQASMVKDRLRAQNIKSITIPNLSTDLTPLQPAWRSYHHRLGYPFQESGAGKKVRHCEPIYKAIAPFLREAAVVQDIAAGNMVNGIYAFLAHTKRGRAPFRVIATDINKHSLQIGVQFVKAFGLDPFFFAATANLFDKPAIAHHAQGRAMTLGLVGHLLNKEQFNRLLIVISETLRPGDVAAIDIRLRTSENLLVAEYKFGKNRIEDRADLVWLRSSEQALGNLVDENWVVKAAEDLGLNATLTPEFEMDQMIWKVAILSKN